MAVSHLVTDSPASIIAKSTNNLATPAMGAKYSTVVVMITEVKAVTKPKVVMVVKERMTKDRLGVTAVAEVMAAHHKVSTAKVDRVDSKEAIINKVITKASRVVRVRTNGVSHSRGKANGAEVRVKDRVDTASGKSGQL